MSPGEAAELDQQLLLTLDPIRGLGEGETSRPPGNSYGNTPRKSQAVLSLGKAVATNPVERKNSHQASGESWLHHAAVADLEWERIRKG